MGSVEIVMQESVAKGLYLESRRVHRNWIAMALTLVFLLWWIRAEFKAAVRLVWVGLLSHILYFFTRQFVRGSHRARKAKKQVAVNSHRSSESSGGWKIITEQFVRGVHSDASVLVDSDAN